MLNRLEQLRGIGGDLDGGVSRLAYSPADVQARDLTAQWMTEAGLQVWVDEAANLFGRLPGSGQLPSALMTGSHLDSVARAGALDGPAGVVAGLASAEALRQSGLTLEHDLVIVAFANEEGARGTPGMVGSKAMAGRIGPEDLERADAEGATLADRLRDAGGAPERIGQAAWSPEQISAFLELHIEQGPVLEAAGAQLGVVSHITGQLPVTASISGQANHAGTTPMPRRRDAAVAAARLILAVEALANDGHVRVATTGTIHVGPGVRNVVPGDATLGIDIRDVSSQRMLIAFDLLKGWARDIAEDTGTIIELQPGSLVDPVAADVQLAGHLADAADRLGATWLTLPSGAGHDAQIMATIAPMAVIFVPSIGGISHSPDEATAPEHLVLGANALLGGLIAADAAR
ncbi:Zn-dependent hydrolase [Mycolicibacterium boenickei]